MDFSRLEEVRQVPSLRPTSYSDDAAGSAERGVIRVGPPTTYLKEGLRTEEVLRLLGKPVAISERSEKDLVVTTYEFRRGEGRILIAEFVSGVLVRSRTETRAGPTAEVVGN